ncbi:MAG: hypothetical protein NC400_04070 [Clostridium sp.]|nr:hypothetical protein [Clostridium sp.]
MAEEYSKLQLEDKALKSATMYFGQELLSYFHVKGKILRMLPTEQIRLEAVRGTEDMLFEMEDGTLVHLEFESVEVNEDDLRRYRVYDAYTEMIYKKPVITYVLCSGKTKRIHSELKGGINPYRVIPLHMKERDADALFVELKRRAGSGNLSKENLIPLLLTPLMSGKSSIKDRILEAKKILDKENRQLSKADRQHMEGILYAFACKFLEGADLNKVKEELSMTVLGEMIWSDGEKAGIEKGKSVHLISLVCRKLSKGKTPAQISEELEEELPTVEHICEIAGKCSPEYDCEKIYQLLSQTT